MYACSSRNEETELLPNENKHKRRRIPSNVACLLYSAPHKLRMNVHLGRSYPDGPIQLGKLVRKNNQATANDPGCARVGREAKGVECEGQAFKLPTLHYARQRSAMRILGGLNLAILEVSFGGGKDSTGRAW